MKVQNSNIIVGSSGLASVDIVNENNIKITLKNGTTLTFIPKIEDFDKVSFEMEYLTGKENKQIEKLKNKMKELESQISGIKENTQSEYNEEDELYNEEDEEQYDENKINELL